MAAFWRDLGRVFIKSSSNNRAASPQSLYERLRTRSRSARRAARTMRCLAEALESRQMLAVLPTPTSIRPFDIAAPVSNPDRYANTPSIAYNPVNPQQMVSVYAFYDPSLPDYLQRTTIVGRYTNNGGQTWASFGIGGNASDPLSDPNDVRPLEWATEPSVAFDRENNLYLVYRQHRVDDAAGNIMLRKYNMSGGAPNQVLTNTLYWWAQADPAYTPMVAVDNNLPSFVDPADPTSQVMDPHVGNVYVAWTMNTTAPQRPPIPFNPNTIKIVGSNDGGVSFSAHGFATADQHASSRRNASPRLVVSQGTPDGRVAGGRVTIVYDDFSRSSSPNADVIWVNGFSDGVKQHVGTHAGGSIRDAWSGGYEDVNTFPTAGGGPRSLTLVNWGGNDSQLFGGDPSPDIITADFNATNNGLSLLVGDGSGTFGDPQSAPAVAFSSANKPTSVITLSDGRIAVTSSGNNRVLVITYDPGTQTTSEVFFNVGNNPQQVVAADIDGDGDQDLLVVNQGSNNFSLLRNTGATFAAAVNTATGAAPRSLATGDLDGDGDLDVVVANSTDGTVSVFLNDGTGAFTEEPTESPRAITPVLGFGSTFTHTPVYVGVAEMNGDGIVDLVVGSQNAGPGAQSTIGVLLGVGDGTFLDARDSAAGTQLNSFMLTDIDGDGRQDVIVADNGGSANLLFNSGSPRLSAPFQVGMAGGTYGVLLVDVSADGIRDLITANSTANNIAVRLGTDSGDPAIPMETRYEVQLNLPDNLFVLKDLDIELILQTPDIKDKLIQLEAPDGTRVTLLENKQDAAGNTRPGDPGLTGSFLGTIGEFGFQRIGTVFDQEAARSIKDPTSAAPWTAHFRPETGGAGLATFYGWTAAQMSGDGRTTPWTLVITDFEVEEDPDPVPTLFGWKLICTGGGLSVGTDVAVSTSGLRGALTSPYPNAGSFGPMPDRGIGPAASIASDNTLGAFSQFQGRLYVAFTDSAGGGDIVMAVSDDGGLTWRVTDAKVNDDNGALDGFSGGNRPQFQPEVAVDQSTGTLAVSFYDARHDASAVRVAQYVAVSIDGGMTWAPQTFANQPVMTTDAVTLQPKILGPLPDNQSAGNPGREAQFGFGDRQGLAFVNGHIFPVWAGNRNGTPQGIFSADVVVATGPRIVDSTMGPVSLPGDSLNPADPLGSPVLQKFRVTFDRPIDPTTFTTSDIRVFYRDTTTTNATGREVVVGSVAPINLGFFPPNINPALGATIFEVTLAEPQTATGTYSYIISPNLNDRVRKPIVTLGGARYYTTEAAQRNVRVPSVGFGGDQVTPANNLAQSTITVAGADASEVITDLQVEVWLPHAMASDLILTLVAPDGTRVLLAELRGGTDANFIGTRFDDAAALPIGDPTALAPFTGSFQPEESLLGNLDPTVINGNWVLEVEDTVDGSIGMIADWRLFIQTAARFVPAPDQIGLAIPSVGTGGSGDPAEDSTVSTITIANIPADNLIEDINVQVTIDHPAVEELTLTLIAPDGRRIPLLFSGIVTGANFTNTVFDDQAVDDIAAGVAPYTGSFMSAGLLSTLNGSRVNGDWKLEIVDATDGNGGTLVDWSLLIRTGSGNLSDQNANAVQEEPAVSPAVTPPGTIGDVYAIPTPTQPNSYDGTKFAPPYDQNTLPLIVPGPHIIKTTTGATFTATNLQVYRPVPALDTGGTGVWWQDMTFSTIAVSANPNAVVADVNVSLTLLHNRVSDLKITLIAPNGAQLVLADHVGGAGQGFVNTVFDDAATQLITDGTVPFTGRFRTTLPLAGNWMLWIEDTVAGETGTLISWSLDVQTTLATTGENLMLDNTINSIDVTFDRDMDPASFTPTEILRVMGPLGQIYPTAAEPFVVTGNPLGSDPDPLYPRTYRITFPRQELSGTYTVTLAPTIRSRPTAAWPGGEQVDYNLNAGVDLLRGVSASAVPVTFRNNNVWVFGPGAPPGQPAPTITIPSGFIVQNSGTLVQLDITYPFDPDLEAVLISPLGTRIGLFHDVGNGIRTANFRQTVFDDAAATQIQNGAADFFGRYKPLPLTQGPFAGLTLSALAGEFSGGTWTLEITSKNPNVTGTLNGWSLTLLKPTPDSGLGELVADQTSVSARIFTQNPTNPLSHNVWTSVGPAANNGGANSGRIGGLAVDPSDTSGNTVYVGGASGGVWKTTNFLTTDPMGPTWIPLTDFGPIFSMNIGSIAVFGRNNDPRQSIVFAGTGEGDVGTTGVGFLRSMDGGVNWDLFDSTTNVDDQGNVLAIDDARRDHLFVGTTVWKVVVDPRPTITGEIIVYAAIWDHNVSATSNRGGIWRSLDSGKHWTQMRAGSGNASDIILDENSGYFDAHSNPTGNLQVVYAGFEGEGVFRSPNRGQVWGLMAGDVGTALLINAFVAGRPPIVVQHPGVPDYTGFNPLNAPNGTNIERIVLAKPHLTGDAAEDLLYQGWVYALAVAEVVHVPTNTTVHVANLYMTKDYGQNWTRLRIGIGNNAVGDIGVDVGGGTLGNYNLSISVDPNNPSVVYLGGIGSGFIRVNIDNLSDAHSLFRNPDRNDGGLPDYGGPDPVQLNNPVGPGYSAQNNPITPFTPATSIAPYPATASYLGGYINLIANPLNRFDTNSSVLTGNVLDFANSGVGARATVVSWGSTYMDSQHRLITLKDPLTGHSRLVFGNDYGVGTSVVAADGTPVLGIGTAISTNGDRNGNLGITQFFYGAAQPSSLAAQAALSLFYGMSHANGYPSSNPDVLRTGDLDWTSDSSVDFRGSGGGVATDSTGSGTIYKNKWPVDVVPPTNMSPPNNPTDFFQVFPDGSPLFIGRTFGLLQTTTGPAPTRDPQWPNSFAPIAPIPTVSTFAVNPISKDHMVISSLAGRIFATENQGKFWSVVGDPAALDGTYAPALAYGAPDPAGPGGSDPTNFFLYAGTVSGNIFVTFTGGGANGNDWLNISAGLDGSPVRAIVTNPLRGSHEAFAVTDTGIFHMPDSTLPNRRWVNITGNIFSLNHNSFNATDDPDALDMTENKLRRLTSMVADWRYVIPDDLSNPTGPTHPVLYAAGDSGVYRSLDLGATWNHFPDDVLDQAPRAGGYLPNVQVTDLDLSLGNIQPTNGRENAAAGGLNVLLASTFGRGAFAIRLAPAIIGGTLQMSTASDTGISNTDMVTKDARPVFSGLSQQSAFGNHVRISILNANDPDNPIVIGGFSGTFGDYTDVAANYTDEFGRFTVQIYPGVMLEGVFNIGIRATDDAGTVGGMAILPRPLTFDITPPSLVPGHAAKTVTAKEGELFTAVVAEFADTSSQCTATIDWGDGTTSAGVVKANPGGWYDVEGTHRYTNPGTFNIRVTVTDPAGNDSTAIPATAFISNPMIVPAGGLQYTVNEGDNFASQPVATFIDPGGAGALSEYLASIDWGDGTVTFGTITYNATTDVFTVSGGHFFPDSGVRTLTVWILHDNLPLVSTTSTMTVQNVAPTPTFVGPTFVFATVPMTFTIGATDMSPADQAAGFKYVINWGDGTPAQTIAAAANNGAPRTITHTYAAPGTYQAYLTATDKDGGIGASGILSLKVNEPSSLQNVVINKGEDQRSKIKFIQFTPVSGGQVMPSFSLKNLKLMRNGSVVVSMKGAKLAYRNGLVTLDLQQVALSDGDYQLQVTLANGAIKPIDFHRLGGDTDGDRLIGLADWNLVKKNQGYRYGQAGYVANADVDGSGVVDANDVRIVRDNYGRSLRGYRQKVLMYPNKTPAFGKVDFGNVDANGILKIVDLAFWNMGSTGTMKIRGLSLAGGSGTFSFGVPGSTWADPTGEFAIGAAKALTMRIYLTPNTAGLATNQLVFQYSTNGKTWANGKINLQANIS